MPCPKCGKPAHPFNYLNTVNGVMLYYRCECGHKWESWFVPIKNMCEVK